METIRKIYSLLESDQKTRCALLLVVFSISALFQVAGVASIAPFVALLDNNELIHTNKWLSFAYETVGVSSDTEFLVGFAAFVMVMTISSNLVGALTTRVSIHTSQELGTQFQRDMYKGYLRRDYALMARLNTASLMSALSQETGRFVYMVLTPLLNLISYVLTALTIVILLLVIDPLAAIAVSLVIGVIYATTYRLSTSRLTFHGKRVGEINDRRFRLMSESLGGLKEVKLLGTESQYQAAFTKLNDEGRESNVAIILLADLPRYFLEAAAFSALLGLAIYMLLQGASNDSIVAVLSLYAMAGYRLLPVAQNILRCASSIKANASVIEILEPHIRIGRQLQSSDNDGAPPLPIPPGPIELDCITYTYPESPQPALHEVSIRIPSRAITVLVGPSGAGKSTLADVLLGLLRPSSGSLKIDGQPIDQSNVRSWQRNLGYVPQSIYVLDATIAENIAMGSPGSPSMERVAKAARLASLSSFVEALPAGYQQTTGERGGVLSGGQRQRIGIARALYHDAQVLIMDEATSALDAVTENEVLDSLRALRRDKTIIMVAHRLSTIQSADWVVFLKGGRVVAQGTYQDLAQQSDDFRELLTAAKHVSHNQIN